MPNSDDQQRTTVERVADVVLGTAFEGIETVEGGILAIWRFNKSVFRTVEQVTEPLRKPLDALGVSAMVRKPVEALGANVETAVIRLEEKGRAGLIQSDSLAIQTFSTTVDAIVDYLAESPAVDLLIRRQIEKLLPVLGMHPDVQNLVRDQVNSILPTLVQDERIQAIIRSQAGAYLAFLEKNPQIVQPLIRSQGDTYIEYLNANPASVQSLLQGQSVSMAGVMMDEVRERTVTADSVVETIVRNILRRKPREELAAPPEDVQRRAETARLPSDFVTPSRNGGYE